MTSRFDIERAVLASDLPKLERLLMFVLLAHADNESAAIKPRFSPSLTDLAKESGMGRNTVQAILRKLDTKGWVSRQRPPAEKSRKGAQTRYWLAIPVSETDTGGRSMTDPAVGRVATQLGGTVTQGGSHSDPSVGRAVSKPRSHSDPKEVTQSLADTHSTTRAGARSDASRNGRAPAEWLAPTVEFVSQQLTVATGRTYDPRDVTDSVTAFLRGKSVTSPDAFVRKCAQQNPLQFAPTGGIPPRFRREDYQ